jgi:hypothetical protein
MNKIEAVTVCIGYADFLAETLAENLPLLDSMTVITSPDDAATISVCRKHSLHFVTSEDHKRGGSFNKGRLIRRLFDQVAGDEWVLHLDADIVLPRKFRRLLELAHLDERCLYGADRQDIVGYDAWRSLKGYAGAWDNHAHENGHWFHPRHGAGSRWVSSIHGYCPIGFFQLFHGSELIKGGYHQRNYPIHHGDAARSDVQFALQWDRRHRQLLPELIVLHLTSEDAGMGANWSGRKTKPFGPDPHRPNPPHPCS